MSGFSIGWLDLREAADRRARDAELLRRAARWLQAVDPYCSESIAMDLGAGTGATLRAFTGLSNTGQPGTGPGDSAAQPVAWRLVDNDAALLAEASRRHAHACRLQTVVQDLSDIAALPLAGVRLVTASALFDLVSTELVDALAVALHTHSRQQPVGLYAALNYDGSTEWSPLHPLDTAVLAAFNRDQRRDKGLGPALGPESGWYLERVFSELGFSVLAASTPWVLGTEERQLTEALIDGIAAAVATDAALDRAALDDWRAFRRLHAGTGSCKVGHRDILALPTTLPV